MIIAFVRKLRACLPVFILFLIASCSTIPRDYPRKVTYALSPEETKQTALANALVPQLKANPDKSVIVPLSQGIDALAARLGLALYAEKTLDVQYYIWRGDTTGNAVAYSLLQAADRGVRVRLLLDDLQGSSHDLALLALNDHPQIEIRMFNPSAARSIKAFEFLSRFDRLNRRMHNKSFIADNQMAIVGGRNIGDEYFNADPDVDFSDFDVLTAGPVVPEISGIFDMYWNSELATPVSALYQDQETTHSLKELRTNLDKAWQQTQSSEYAKAVRRSRFVREMNDNKVEHYLGRAQAVSDAPEKLLHKSNDITTHMGPQIQSLVGKLDSELLIISPYFVPGDTMLETFAKLVRRDVRVIIVTNSFASNDVGIVHAGYAKYREALLKAGVELYEYKPDPTRITRRASGLTGSSRASLHAKIFVFDRRQLFVGSMNLDPRSIRLNTEMGIIIDSPEMATKVSSVTQAKLAENTYRLSIEKATDEQTGVTAKELRWETLEQGQNVIYKKEPQVGFFRKLGIWFMSLFISEDLL